MELELGLALGDHGDHAGVVGARREFGEPDLVATHEELNAEDAQAGAVSVLGEGVGDFLGHLPGGGERLLAHGHRLPGLDVVAVLLAVANGHAEGGEDAGACCVPRAHGEQGDLVVEVDALLDDDHTGCRTRILLGVDPRRLRLLGIAHARLPVAG